MVERRGNHVLVWAAIGLAAMAAAVACFLPAFEIRIEAFIGAGDEQRGFDYVRELTLAGEPFGLLPLGAALALVACAVAALVRGSRRWLVLSAFVLASGLAVLVLEMEDTSRLRWEESGVTGYEEPSGGPLLQPSLDELKAAARRSPEAQEPGWELLAEHGYAARGLVGWRLFTWSALSLWWLTAYLLARLRLRPVPAALAVASATILVTGWLVLRALSGLA